MAEHACVCRHDRSSECAFLYLVVSAAGCALVGVGTLARGQQTGPESWAEQRQIQHPAKAVCEGINMGSFSCAQV